MINLIAEITHRYQLNVIKPNVDTILINNLSSDGIKVGEKLVGENFNQVP